jgi:hypothetical protein
MSSLICGAKKIDHTEVESEWWLPEELKRGAYREG